MYSRKRREFGIETAPPLKILSRWTCDRCHEEVPYTSCWSYVYLCCGLQGSSLRLLGCRGAPERALLHAAHWKHWYYRESQSCELRRISSSVNPQSVSNSALRLQSKRKFRTTENSIDSLKIPNPNVFDKLKTLTPIFTMITVLA